MFGYYRPFRLNIDSSEKNLFEAYYCRICYCLWNNGGQFSRALTTFDAALYSIVLKLGGIGERPDHVKCQKIRHDVKNTFNDDVIGSRLARLTLVGFGGKMEDDFTDKEYLKAWFIKIIFGRGIKKAYEKEPVFATNTREVCAEIDEYQKANAEANLPLDAYAKSAVKNFSTFGPLDEKYKTVLYNMARWSFFVDMLCDYSKDYKGKAPNSFMDERYPTMKDMLDEQWFTLVPMIRKENTDLMNSVMAIRDDSTEWKLLFHIVGDAVGRMSAGVLRNKDIGFNYFKELLFNWGRYFHNRKVSRIWKRSGHGNN